MIARKRCSPSALKRFDACPRSWRYSRDYEQPEKASVKLGKKSHAWLEGYMGSTGPADLRAREGRLVLPGLHLLADVPRGGVAKLEQHFALRFDGVDFHGFIDLRHGALVIDHKTTKDIARYALTEAELAGDLQRTIYAAGVLDGHVIEHSPDGAELGATDEPMSRQLEHTDCRWVYYATVHHRGQDRSEWAAKREHSEPRSRTRERMGDVVMPIARRMLPLWDAPARDFDRDLGRCDDYGGCPYRETCWTEQSPTRAERAKGAEMSSVLDRLRAKQAEQAAGAAPPAATDDTTGGGANPDEGDEELLFSPDQQPLGASTTPPAGPPVTAPATKPDGPKLPPKKRSLASTTPSAEPMPPAHRRLPIDAVLKVVMCSNTAEAARDMLEVVADWAAE